MPTTTKTTVTKRTRNRRRPTRKFKKRSTVLVVPRHLAPFPSRMITTLKYSEQASIGSTLGSIGYYSYRANGIYDPNATGVGAQPMGFDQMMTWYNHFQVLKSHITVEVIPATASSTGVTLVLVHDDDTANTYGLNGAIETKGAKHVVLGPSYDYTKKLTMGYNQKKVFGASRSNLIGSASADPTETQNWTLIHGVNDGSSSATTYFRVTIWYTVMFFELRDVPRS